MAARARCLAAGSAAQDGADQVGVVRAGDDEEAAVGGQKLDELRHGGLGGGDLAAFHGAGDVAEDAEDALAAGGRGAFAGGNGHDGVDFAGAGGEELVLEGLGPKLTCHASSQPPWLPGLGASSLSCLRIR